MSPVSEAVADSTEVYREQLAQLQREFAGLNYAVSHDLRAPVRALTGFTQALKEQTSGTLDDTSAHFLTRIEQASQRLNTMIDGLLQLSRLTQTELLCAQVDLTQLCAAVVSTLRSRYPNQAPQIQIAAGMHAWCDPRLVRIALEALLSNACKFTMHRSQVDINVSAVQAAQQVTVCVRDNGMGLDMRYADHLFVPFQHQQTRRELQGLGIGLASVQRIISRHAGRLWAEGVPEQAAAFHFTLPIKPPTSLP